MRRHGLKANKKRPFRPVTTESAHDLPVAPNMLVQDFAATSPNQKWVSDISYWWTAQGRMYLCVVLDLYSRRIVGWALMDPLESILVLTAIRRAIGQCHPPPGLIFHSDRGSQYASHAVNQLLILNHMCQSMSRTGNCYDNAVSESWFSGLKTEATPEGGIHTHTKSEAFYNTIRPNATLGFHKSGCVRTTSSGDRLTANCLSILFQLIHPNLHTLVAWLEPITSRSPKWTQPDKPIDTPNWPYLGRIHTLLFFHWRADRRDGSINECKRRRSYAAENLTCCPQMGRIS